MGGSIPPSPTIARPGVSQKQKALDPAHPTCYHPPRSLNGQSTHRAEVWVGVQSPPVRGPLASRKGLQ
jgi:hypothetical protein